MNTLLSVPPTSRVGRYPKHTFRVNSQPFVLQPVAIARVLPGETLKNLFFESRVVTTPVLNPIVGWKQEFYWFYVRITDLMQDAFKEMFIDPENSDLGSAFGEPANSQVWYAAKGGINWLKLATDRVAATYFRDDGEGPYSYLTAAGQHIVQIRENTFLDSLTDEDKMPVGDDIADATTMGDLDRLMDAFEQLRALGLANMTYEDWLRSNGIAIPNKDLNKPELLGRWADYQYPANTIDPVSGAPSSALSWVFRNGGRDPKFFKEPGFVVGYSVTRPKIYFGGLAGSAAGFASRSWDWMPNYLRGMPETQLKPFAVDRGPLGDRVTDLDGYFLDMRDELLHGDQFQNVAAFGANGASDAANHILALPMAADIVWKYPTETMISSFFVGGNGHIRQDGYVSLSIKGFEIDYTQGNIAEA